MEPVVFGLVLAAAILHASWNAMVKTGGDPLVRIALLSGASAVLALPLLVVAGLPPRASWPPLAVSVGLHQVYFGFLVLGYRAGDLSLVYPIARGAAPLLVAVGAWLVVGERLDVVGWSAVAIVSLGIASLSLLRGPGRDATKAVGFGLATAVTIAAYSIADGLGGRAAGAAGILGYVALLNVLQAIPFVGYALARRRRELVLTLRTRWRSTLGGGLFAFGAYGLVIWAMSMTAMSYVSALREISVVIAAGVVLLQWSRLL